MPPSTGFAFSIREQPDFDGFLRTPAFAELQAAAVGGAVILVNVGKRHGDAIVVTADAPPVQIKLPDLDDYDVQTRAAELLDATHDASRLVGQLRKSRVVQETLSWLWDAVVGPILDAAGQLHRVWWQPTGLLNLFPLHAAGHPGRPGALEAVVSSYTPTLRALAHARSRPQARIRRQLTIAIEHTPGHPDLPGTVAEAAHLQANHPDMPILSGENATTDRVLANISTRTWVHFACHATTNSNTPPSSAGLIPGYIRRGAAPPRCP